MCKCHCKRPVSLKCMVGKIRHIFCLFFISKRQWKRRKTTLLLILLPFRLSTFFFVTFLILMLRSARWLSFSFVCFQWLFITILPSDCCKAAGSVFLLYTLMSLVFSNLWDLSCQCTPCYLYQNGLSVDKSGRKYIISCGNDAM